MADERFDLAALVCEFLRRYVDTDPVKADPVELVAAATNACTELLALENQFTSFTGVSASRPAEIGTAIDAWKARHAKFVDDGAQLAELLGKHGAGMERAYAVLGAMKQLGSTFEAINGRLERIATGLDTSLHENAEA
jgi:hypothetical protein